MDSIAILSNLIPTDLDAGSVFSGSPSGRMIRGYAGRNPFTPTENPHYIFHEQSRDLIVWFVDSSDPLYVFGPVGCGKSSLIGQLAAKLNYPVFAITAHSHLEFPDLVGHLTIRQGNMEFEYGPLSLAMKYGGLFLLDEMDLL